MNKIRRKILLNPQKSETGNSPHTHLISDVQGLQTALNDKGFGPQDFPYTDRWFHGLCFGGRSYNQTSPTQIWYVQVLFSKAITISHLGFIMVNTGTSFRLGVYTSNSNSYPGGLLYDTGNITSTGNAFYSHVVSPALTLQPGLYYLAFRNSTNSTGGAFKGYCSVVDSTNINITTDRGPVFLESVAGFGALPASANAEPLSAGQAGPLIFMRKSA